MNYDSSLKLQPCKHSININRKEISRAKHDFSASPATAHILYIIFSRIIHPVTFKQVNSKLKQQQERYSSNLRQSQTVRVVE